MILLFIDHGDYEKAASVYLDLTNRPSILLKLLEKKENKLDEKKLEELTKALYELDEQKCKDDAFALAVTVGDHFDDKKNYSAAEKFYNMAFKWDKTSEELYNKLLRILGA